jgi:uncharacterized FlaG/YvyC family protein
MELEVYTVGKNIPVHKPEYQSSEKRAVKTGNETGKKPLLNAQQTGNLEYNYLKERIENHLKKTFKANTLLNHRLKFYINRELDQVVVKVIDSTTDKVIKEIPPRELQELHIRMREVIGILFDEKI